MKYAKTNYTYSKNKSPQNFRKQEKTSKKRCKQEIAKPKQNKRYDKTWGRIEMKKTRNKNKALNEKLAHKGILKNSTRIDEENQKTVLLEFSKKTVRDFKNLSGIG